MARSQPIQSPFLVPFDGSFELERAPTAPPRGHRTKATEERALAQLLSRLDDLQRRLFADDRHALLLVFQAVDAGGKDGTIRAVLRGVNPAGCQVFSFKAPSTEELDHDFLWRVARALPERGRIGVFNRSHYEEVVTVRVRPELLAAQHLPTAPSDAFWQGRLESIVQAEQHWARSGTVVLKFFLHVSKDEQKRRLLKRLDEPDHRWKFAADDLRVRAQWSETARAYEQALAATSRPWAPWYVIPADEKPFTRRAVAQIVVDALDALDLRYPEPSRARLRELAQLRAKLARTR